MKLDEAVSAGRHRSGINQVWRAAVDGKCQTLMVEKDCKYPTDLSPDGLCQFYTSNDLGIHQQIAAVLRRQIVGGRMLINSTVPEKVGNRPAP